jgi:ATP-dependent DNA helicase PIF1
VTASTGIAGVSIGGTTLHSWAGIGLGMGEPSILATRMRRDDAKRGKSAQTAFKRWRETEVLIIDESKSGLAL